MKTVVFLNLARRQFRKLAPEVQKAVQDKLGRYAETGFGDVKAMTGVPLLRLRCGDYRILFHEDDETIFVREVAHRGTIYR